MRALVLLLTLSLTFAGCIGGKDDPEEPLDTQSADEGTATNTGAAAPTPSPSSKPPTRPGAPTPATPPSAPTPPTAPTPSGPAGNTTVPSTVIVEGDAGAVLAVSPPEGGHNGFNVGFAVLDIPQAAPRTGLLVATWESATPLDASMDIALFDVDGNTLATASGASPVTLEIPGQAFGTSVELRGSAFPTAPGVAAEYTVHFALTIFYA